MTLLIGCGFLGSHVARRFPNNQPLILTTQSKESADRLKKEFPFVEILSSNDTEHLQKLLFDANSVIITVAPKNSFLYRETYLELAENLCSALYKNESVKQIIYTSSTSVYGDCDGSLVDESMMIHPITEQGKILAETEKTLQSLVNEKRKVAILRLSEIYGGERSILSRVKQILENCGVGDGSNPTNMIHVNDAARAILFCFSRKLCGIYNLCDDDHMTRKALYDAVSKKYHLPLITWDPSKKSIHGGRRIIDNSKIKKEGFSFEYKHRFLG